MMWCGGNWRMTRSRPAWTIQHNPVSEKGRKKWSFVFVLHNCLYQSVSFEGVISAHLVWWSYLREEEINIKKNETIIYYFQRYLYKYKSQIKVANFTRSKKKKLLAYESLPIRQDANALLPTCARFIFK